MTIADVKAANCVSAPCALRPWRKNASSVRRVTGILVASLITVFLPATVNAQRLAKANSIDATNLESQQSSTVEERQLVSILKQNLPQSDQTLQMSDAPEWFQALMQRIVRQNIPDKYVRDKDWGKTTKRWDGLEIRRKGPLRVSTKRKWKEVNHGSWTRYEIQQVNPNENLLLKIENVHDAQRGKVGFEVELASKLKVHGRRAKWTKGVQLFSVSADADASAVMRLSCEVGMRLDVGKFPPDVVMVPKVTKADLKVTDFRLRSISKLDGPIVKQLSKSVHKVLLEKIDEKRHQLPKKINKEIAKNEDKLRLSMADFAASKWNSLTSGSSSAGETKQVDETKRPQGGSQSVRVSDDLAAGRKTKSVVVEGARLATNSTKITPAEQELVEEVTPLKSYNRERTAADTYRSHEVKLIDLLGTQPGEWAAGHPRSKPVEPKMDGPVPDGF